MELNLNELKERALELKDIESLITIENEDFLTTSFVKVFKNEELNNNFFSIKLLFTQIKEKQLVTERVQSLMHNLTKLKITSLTNDFCKARKIIYKYLNQGSVNIKDLVKENKSFEKNILDLKEVFSSYFSKIEELSNEKYTSQRRKVSNFIKKLNDLHKEQEDLLTKGSAYFLQTSKEIMKKEKEFKCEIE